MYCICFVSRSIYLLVFIFMCILYLSLWFFCHCFMLQLLFQLSRYCCWPSVYEMNPPNIQPVHPHKFINSGGLIFCEKCAILSTDPRAQAPGGCPYPTHGTQHEYHITSHHHTFFTVHLSILHLLYSLRFVFLFDF